jgi:DNA topoisomerase-3
MRLIIAEKPSVARDIGRALGAQNRHNGYLEGSGLRISWCVGHMFELENPAHYSADWKRWSMDTLPMIPDMFALKLREGMTDHWKVLNRLLRDPETTDVVNACDAGREGELIFRYVYQVAGCQLPVLRLWVSSLTNQAILAGWKQLRPSSRYDALADAARCRSEADWLVGLNVTRAMTCLARSGGGEQLLSVGRVQTPTLAMIVRRDQEIDAFVSEPFWQVKAKLAATSGDTVAKWDGLWFRSLTAHDKKTLPGEVPTARPHRARSACSAPPTASDASSRHRCSTI